MHFDSAPEALHLSRRKAPYTEKYKQTLASKLARPVYIFLCMAGIDYE